MSKKVYVDLHVIQTVPPSCVNRDDTNSPKTAIYGGVRRARVSSQSWKRAMRLMFSNYFKEDELGVRTKKIIELVADKICSFDSSKSNEEAMKMAEKFINLSGVNTKDKEAKALFFMSRKQAENLAQLALSNEETDKKKAQAALNRNHGIDIALFGRMVADDPSLNADASAQIAHSISTHEVENEYDYFTATDDCSPEDQSGAGMIGTVEFNSSTLYRYGTIAVHEFFKQLDGNQEVTAKAVKEFVRAFITSMPTGKQNTFANRTLPDAVMLTIRFDQPINLVGAFEEPVKGKGYTKASIRKLVEYAESVYEDYSSNPECTFVIGNDLSRIGEKMDHDTLLSRVEEKIKSFFS
jgi:CRISPR system Cascade subunit CasC